MLVGGRRRRLRGDLTFQGSPRSGTKFTVAQASDDTSANPLAVKKEWAADTNIIRLHDAKHGTKLQAPRRSPARFAITPRLWTSRIWDPWVRAMANANGRDQKVHRTNSGSCMLSTGNSDLFPNDMVAPNNALRIDPAPATDGQHLCDGQTNKLVTNVTRREHQVSAWRMYNGG